MINKGLHRQKTNAYNHTSMKMPKHVEATYSNFDLHIYLSAAEYKTKAHSSIKDIQTMCIKRSS